VINSLRTGPAHPSGKMMDEKGKKVIETLAREHHYKVKNG
jgi:hypothetical protein